MTLRATSGRPCPEAATSALLLTGAIVTTVIWGMNPKAFLSAVRESAVRPGFKHQCRAENTL
jgi:hypothetical protein